MDTTQLNGFDNLLTNLKNKLNFSPVKVTEILSGMNNRLFCLDDNKSRILGKFYLKDNKRRLFREFQALTFLNQKGFANVPVAYFKNDSFGYAAYSFEDGRSKTAKELTKNDLDQMLDFILDLQNLTPENTAFNFLLGVNACLSIQDYINNINTRLQKFNQALQKNETNEKVIDLNKKFKINATLNRLVKNAVSDINKNFIETQLTPNQRRLSPVDFGTHNILFKNDKPVCILDFEYFGWDDPLRLVADFINHDQTAVLPKDLKGYFVEEYRSRSNLPEATLKRLQTVINLIAIEWLTIHLQALTPEKMRARQFSNKNFDLDTYTTDQITRFEGRLATLI